MLAARAIWPRRFLFKQSAEVADVLHGVLQDAHLAHLLDRGGGGHVPLQGVEALVHRLHPVPLPRVPLDRLQVLLRLDHVAVDRVDRHHLAPRTHRSGIPKEIFLLNPSNVTDIFFQV